MHSMIVKSLVLAGVGAAGAGAGAVIEHVTAAASPATSVIHACSLNHIGTLRMVNSASDCVAIETAVSWNVTGPAGATGATGAAGANGTTGAVGATGPAGPAGADGTAGANGKDGAAGVPGTQGLQGLAGPAGPPGSGLSKAALYTMTNWDVRGASEVSCKTTDDVMTQCSCDRELAFIARESFDTCRCESPTAIADCISSTGTGTSADVTCGGTPPSNYGYGCSVLNGVGNVIWCDGSCGGKPIPDPITITFSNSANKNVVELETAPCNGAPAKQVHGALGNGDSFAITGLPGCYILTAVVGSFSVTKNVNVAAGGSFTWEIGQ